METAAPHLLKDLFKAGLSTEADTHTGPLRKPLAHGAGH